MAKSGMELKVRVWSDTAERPFDVVALDHDKGNQHYQPNVEFSTKEGAEKHLATLANQLAMTPTSINFIRDHWPVDGGIE